MRLRRTALLAAVLIAGGLAMAPPFPDVAGQAVVISLDRSACKGTCPVYRVEITGEGLVTYEGREHVAALGVRTRRIPREAVSRLVDRFRAADFFSLQASYAADVDDVPGATIGLRVGETSKTVSDYFGFQVGMPRSVNDLETAVDEAAGTAEWIGAR
jgi:hypothetical protein